MDVIHHFVCECGCTCREGEVWLRSGVRLGYLRHFTQFLKSHAENGFIDSDFQQFYFKDHVSIGWNERRPFNTK